MMDFIFVLLGFFAIVSAFFAIYSKESINNTFSFLVTVLSIAGLFAMLQAPFLFLIQIIVYAGAVITLILIIVMFLNIKEENLPKEPKKLNFLLLGALLVAPVDIFILKAVSTLPAGDLSVSKGDFVSLKVLGLELYDKWVFPFEMVSILLIVSLVGAIVFAKRRI